MVQLDQLTKEQLSVIRELYAAGVRTPSPILQATRTASLSTVDHIQTHFYIPETGRPMVLEPFQQIITRIAAGEHSYPTLRPFYTTIEYSTGKKSGKALAIDTPIPTATGWKAMQDIQPGDQVFDEHGQLCTVLHATEIMHDHLCYLVRFSDGSELVADHDHLWQVEEVYGKHRSYILTTGQLVEDLYRGGQPKWRVPLADSLKLPQIELPIEPYVLGVWLGDGDNARARLTCVDQQILDELELAGVSVKPVVSTGRAQQYSLDSNAETGSKSNSYATKSETLTAKLRTLDLLHNKHIPIQYLRAGTQQRLSLLQGLMDTDGTVSTDGKECEFSVTHEPLAKSTLELVRSLGYKANIRKAPAILNGKQCGYRYRIGFHATADMPVFRLDRKACRLQARSTMKHGSRSIASIEAVQSVPVKCIQVDSQSHLYLAGETLIPTHNTAWSGAYARARSESRTLKDEILFFANDETQAKGRGYAALRLSIELSPLYDKVHRLLKDEDGNVVWRVTDQELEHVPTGTLVKAVNVDYRGEAGANPTLTVWTEAWGYDTEKQELLFDEMTPVLTRMNSQRLLEGYAGYTGKSIVLEKVESLLTDPDKGGRQLTLDDIPDWPWPDEEKLPLYVNDDAGAFGYIERGLASVRRRMPWLQGERGDRYYAEQRLTLHDPMQFDRLHENKWVSPVDAFIPIEVWLACADASVGSLEPWRSPVVIKEVPEIDSQLQPDDPRLEQIVTAAGVDKPELLIGQRLIDLYMKPWNWRVTGEPVAVALAGDASVTGDCTALVACSRHPDRHQDAVLRMGWKWDPPRGAKIDYDYTPNRHTGLSFRQQLIKTCMEYNVVEFAYDEWQLHHLTNELRREAVVWCRPFKQGIERDIADKQLHDLIMGKRISYWPGESVQVLCLEDIRKHLAGASRTVKPKEDTKLHIVKAQSDSKIDLVVALSMATAECLRLDL